MTTRNDTNGQDITLSLDTLIKVCESASGLARDEARRQMRSIEDNIFTAYHPDTLEDDRYLALSHAHTSTEWYLRASKQYAQAVDQLFFLVEAKHRDGTITIER